MEQPSASAVNLTSSGSNSFRIAADLTANRQRYNESVMQVRFRYDVWDHTGASSTVVKTDLGNQPCQASN